MSVYSKTFYGPNTWPLSSVTLLSTVPAGKVWVLKTIIWVSTSSLANQVGVIYARGTGTADRIWRKPIVANDTIVQDTRVVLEAGESLYGQWGTANATVTLSGYEFNT